jgi:hypothetical protein
MRGSLAMHVSMSSKQYPQYSLFDLHMHQHTHTHIHINIHIRINAREHVLEAIPPKVAVISI